MDEYLNTQCKAPINIRTLLKHIFFTTFETPSQPSGWHLQLKYMNYKTLLPTIWLIAIMTAIGLYIHHYTEREVFWGGYIVMVVFYAAVFLLGTIAAQRYRSNSVSDVLLAGRSIPLWVGAFTMGATWVDGGYINGSAESTYNLGLMWVQAPWGYALSLVVGGMFFARKMRRYGFSTMLDPLAQRFGKRMAAVLFLPALSGEVFWTAAILTALGTTFATVLGLDFDTSIILSSAIAIAYTALGGLWAVALTDVIQMALLLVGLYLVMPFALHSVGGWDAAWESYQAKKGALASFLPSREALGSYYWNWWDYALLLIFGGVAWQVYFQRVLSARSENAAVWLSYLAALACLVAAIPAIVLGIVGDSVTSWESFGASAPDQPALVLPFVMRYLVPGAVASIGLGAIAAAVMSSVDSSILSASSMAAWNVFRPLVRPNISNENLTKVVKSCIWIIGIGATLLALNVKSVYALWVLCSDFVYCLLFPQLVLALFDKKANAWGSAAGFAVAFMLRFGGGDATLGLPILLPYPMVEDGLVLFPFRTLAMASSFLTIMLVSRLTQRQCPARPLEVMD